MQTLPDGTRCSVPVQREAPAAAVRLISDFFRAAFPDLVRTFLSRVCV